MKKLSLFLFLAAFMSECLFGQITVWRNGEVVYETEYAIDSISLIHNRDHSVYDFSDISHVQERISGLYYQFGRDKSYRNRLACGYQGLNTDIEYYIKTTIQNSQYSISSEGTNELSATNGNDPWNALTTLIHEAGLVAEGIRAHCDTTQAEYAYALGEVLTLRSFAYLEMIKLWGDIPLDYFEFVQAPVLTPKVDRNIVFERIRTDLKQAALLMPWSESCPNIGTFSSMRVYSDGYRILENDYRHYMEENSSPNNYTGRPSKAAALALLARADLMYAGKAVRPDNWTVGGGSSYSVQYNIKDAAKRKEIYQEVLQVCAQIINHESYKLLPKYEDIFKNICADVTDYSQSEVIWEIPFKNNARGQFLNYNMVKVNANAIGKLINTVEGTAGTRSNSAICIVPTFYYDFEQGDVRRDVTISPYNWDYSNNISSKIPDFAQEGQSYLYQKLNTIHRFYLRKYRAEWMKRDFLNTDDGINYPIIRFADVLLMFSEASIGGISGDVPANYTGIDGSATFNQVRARAGLSPKTLTMENLMKERAFEFCGEYIRKYDLMRWGVLKEKLVETNTRLQNMAAHTGEFAQLGDTVYCKYRLDNTYTKTGEPGLVIEQLWGLNKGETGMPAGYDPQNGWIRTDIYNRDGENYLQSYKLYEDAAIIDAHQYWPIFPVNVLNSDGNLWNDYAY